MTPLARRAVLQAIPPKGLKAGAERTDQKDPAIGSERHLHNLLLRGAIMDPSLLPTRVELFHTAVGTAFADILIDGRHRETWPIRSRRFKAFLRSSYYKATGTAASTLVIKVALDQLEAQAQFDAPERLVHLRVAEHQGRLYLDLANAHWQAVEIVSGTWQVIDKPPVRFRRPPGLLPLPMPEHGGSLEVLRLLLNLPTENDFVLVVAWLLAALRANGPYPLLAIAGEQGSAKTVLCKILKAIIDPNVAPVRALARDERELMIAANNSHVLAFDNVSGLPSWLSDALCRVASGGSLAVRQLYTDDEEVLFQAARPTLINGIEDVVIRPDLADRTVFLTLPPIPEEQRRPERALWRDFERKRPLILGALLDATAHGLNRRSRIRSGALPRMADFALWASVCETALWPAGTAARAYAATRQAAIEGVIEVDPVAVCVRDMMARHRQWSGTASDFLRAADILQREEVSIRRPDWPRTPRALAGRLRRAQTSLRTVGIDIAFLREGHAGNRVIRLRKHG
jgi:hypothetical protein